MPPKEKKKRVVASFSEPEAPVHQVVEVVEEEKIEQEHTPNPTPSPAPEMVAEVDSLFTKDSPGIAPEITVVGKRDRSLGVWVGAMLGIALAVGVSLIVLVKGPQSITSYFAKPTPTPEPTVVPTPTVVALLRGNISIKVTNGGGVAGAGSKMKALLEELGYVVSSVGNADAYTFDSTEIVVKAGGEAIAKLLTEDLKAEYSLGSTSATLESGAAHDAEVIVGKE